MIGVTKVLISQTFDKWADSTKYHLTDRVLTNCYICILPFLTDFWVFYDIKVKLEYHIGVILAKIMKNY